MPKLLVIIGILVGIPRIEYTHTYVFNIIGNNLTEKHKALQWSNYLES